MALHNLNTPSRVGRRQRPRRHHDPTWNPPAIVTDQSSTPVKTSVRGYLWTWGIALTVLGFVVLTWASIAVRWWRDAIPAAVLRSMPLLPLLILAALTPLVWWTRQRRIEAVMRGELEVEEPHELGVFGVEAPVGFFAANRNRVVACAMSGAAAMGALALVGIVRANAFTSGLVIVAASVVILAALVAPVVWYVRHRRLSIEDDETNLDLLEGHVSSRSDAPAATLTP